MEQILREKGGDIDGKNQVLSQAGNAQAWSEACTCQRSRPVQAVAVDQEVLVIS